MIMPLFPVMRPMRAAQWFFPSCWRRLPKAWVFRWTGATRAPEALCISGGASPCSAQWHATFIAGKFGKRHSIGTALLVIGLGICCAGFAGNYMWLTGAVILSALGQGVFEVLVTPTVQTLHEKEDPSRYINVTHAFWSIGVVSIVILSGWALGAGVSWRVILFFTGIAALIPGILFLAPSKKQHFPSLGTPVSGCDLESDETGSAHPQVLDFSCLHVSCRRGRALPFVLASLFYPYGISERQSALRARHRVFCCRNGCRTSSLRDIRK